MFERRTFHDPERMGFVFRTPLRLGGTSWLIRRGICSIKTGNAPVRPRLICLDGANISREEVIKTAKLAQLELKDADVERTTVEFQRIIDFFNKMSELDLENVEPMARPSDNTNVFRDDAPKSFDDV